MAVRGGPEQRRQSMRDLVKRLNELCDAAPFQASWYLKDFATGASADRRGDVPVPSASTRKISIMMAALAAVHAGKLALDQKVTSEAVGLTGTVHRYGIPPKLGPDNSLDRVTTTTPNDQGLLLELILKGTDDA